MMRTATIVMAFQRRLDIWIASLGFRWRLDDRWLALIAANGRFRHFDLDVIRDLQLHGLFVELHDLPVDPAGRDHLVVDLQVVDELLHFLLLLLTRDDDDEIEDGEDHRQRNEHLKKASAFRAYAKHA